MIKCFDCKYARNFGRGKITAQLAADKHLRRMPHHRVVRYEINPVEIFERDETPLFDLATGEVPF